MALVQMVMPKMGESIMEGTILNWLKKVGDRIEQDESVLEVATDKVDTEVPSTHAGVVVEILAKEGEVVPIGKPILVIETAADAPAPSNGVAPAAAAPVQATAPVAATAPSAATANGKSQSERFYSPLVRNIAREEGISLDELDGLPGTGKDNRLTKSDLLAHLGNRKAGAAAPAAPSAPAAVSAPARSVSGDVEIVEMDRMRKMIAQRMVDSKRISPHVTSFVEADVTNLALWRNKMKNEFQKRFGQTLTFTPIFLEAVIKALRDYPMMNASVDGDRILVKKDINLGMAVALPSGNLIVPNIKQADRLNLIGLTEQVNDLARRARENKLTPDDLADGTYTVSNVGSFGNVMGTPIILQPQIGILALGAVRKKPAVIETPQGDTLGIRQMMFLSHSYDHRVVDGALGGMFVRKVADYLEEFDFDRKI